MKRILKYTELWQKKRNELPISGNADAQWLQMRSILDAQMPVTGVIKKPFRFKMPKWGFHILVVLSSAVAVYVGGRIYLSNKQHQAAPNNLQIRHDSPLPATSDTSPAQGVVKPSAAIIALAKAPVSAGTEPLVINQAKPGINTIQNGKQATPDSIKIPALSDMPIHRDSSTDPIQAISQKLARDSAVLDLGKKEIRKDTANVTKKKPPGKKRRKFSIFF